MAFKDKNKQKEYAHQYWLDNKASESARIKTWKVVNKEKLKQQAKEYNEKNCEKITEQKQKYYLRIKEKRAVYAKEYGKNNPHIINKASAKRKASKLDRTPSWLTDDDLWIINEIYDLAAKRTKMHGFKWHVDHIIPLQGKLVSGLHVPANMQVISATDNHRKNNKYKVAI
jgi:hypothetical protein